MKKNLIGNHTILDSKILYTCVDKWNRCEQIYHKIGTISHSPNYSNLKSRKP